MVNNINVNINQINNIQIKKEYNTSSLNKPRTKSINKIINTNKPKKPSTNYNAFKTKPKSINKISISKTEEKGLKKIDICILMPASVRYRFLQEDNGCYFGLL